MALMRRTHVALLFPLLALVACLSSSTSSVDAGASPDGGIASGNDASAPRDANLPPGADAGASSCAPASVAGYSPTWTPPKAPVAACTQGQISSYVACLTSGDPTSAACAPWTAGADGGQNASCLGCIAPEPSTDKTWGPIVLVDGSDFQINVSGCLAIVLHDNGSGCAGNFQALQECEAAACAANCQGGSATALADCTRAADTGGCSNYLAAASCVGGDSGAAAVACVAPGGTFAQRFANVATIFCLDTGDGG
jgi:hypothetical protein